MNKAKLKNYLNVIIGELKHDIDYEDGVFDESATKAIKQALKCKDLLCKDSKDTMIQLNVSVVYHDFNWIDGVVQDCNDPNHIFFTTSNDKDIFNTELEDVERKYVIEVIEAIINNIK